MIYWASTALIAAFLAASATSYVFHTPTIEGVRKLGFPDFFRLQLAVLKLIAIPVLLVPAIPTVAKDWAYAGVALFLFTAIVAHVAHRDPVAFNGINLVLLALLITSRATLP